MGLAPFCSSPGRSASVSAAMLDGRALAKTIRARIAVETADFVGRTGVAPGLSVVVVGDDPASQVYVRHKESAAREAGMAGGVIRLAGDVEAGALLAVIDQLNGDPAVHGILVQLPLPAHIDERAVIERVSAVKDVDGFHPENLGLLAQGSPRFAPCTPWGIRALLIASGIETRGRRAVVLGRSRIVGLPMALLLMQKGLGGDATVTVCHTATPDPRSITREADIVIVAMGRPELVNASWVKPGAVVVDVGIHRGEGGKLVGDVDHASVGPIASWITPVPGGVGPMTIAMLLENTLKAARLATGQASAP